MTAFFGSLGLRLEKQVLRCAKDNNLGQVVRCAKGNNLGALDRGVALPLLIPNLWVEMWDGKDGESSLREG